MNFTAHGLKREEVVDNSASPNTVYAAIFAPQTHTQKVENRCIKNL